MLLLRTNLVHYTPLSTHYIKKYIKQHHIDSNIILSENSHPLFSRTASRDCRQCSARRYFYSKWVVVHAFSLNVLQVISHFFSYHIQRRWRKSSPSARRRVSHLTNTFFFLLPLKASQSSEPKGSDQWKLSDKTLFIYYFTYRFTVPFPVAARSKA